MYKILAYVMLCNSFQAKTHNNTQMITNWDTKFAIGWSLFVIGVMMWFIIYPSSVKTTHTLHLVPTLAPTFVPTAPPTSVPTLAPTIDLWPMLASEPLCNSRNLSYYNQFCCELHVWETSGIGNQLLQILHAIKLGKLRNCSTFSFPDCAAVHHKHACNFDKMWHGHRQHVANIFRINTKVSLQSVQMPYLPVQPPMQSLCIDGWTNNLKGSGWPYCFFEQFDWLLGREYLNAVLDLRKFDKAFAQSQLPQPEDLVIHIRSGDIVQNSRQDLQAYAKKDTQDKIQDTISLIPPCTFYKHVVTKWGYLNATVWIVTQPCDFDCNPCYKPFLKWLKRHKIKTRVTSKSQLDYVKSAAYDLAVFRHARHLVTTCSTFSVFGRLLAKQLDYLYVPNCKVLEPRGLLEGFTGWQFYDENGKTFDVRENLNVLFYNFTWAWEATRAAANGTDLLQILLMNSTIRTIEILERH